MNCWLTAQHSLLFDIKLRKIPEIPKVRKPKIYFAFAKISCERENHLKVHIRHSLHLKLQGDIFIQSFEHFCLINRNEMVHETLLGSTKPINSIINHTLPDMTGAVILMIRLQPALLFLLRWRHFRFLW